MQVSMILAIPFSGVFELTDALFWDRRRPRLHLSPLGTLSQRWQARTPAVPEATKG